MTTLIHSLKFALDFALKVVNYYFFPQKVSGIPSLDFEGNSVHFATFVGPELDLLHAQNEV